MLEFVMIIIFLGAVIAIGLVIVLYYAIFESKPAASHKTGNSNYIVNLNNLNLFENAMKQLENQIHQQANYYSLDNDFTQIFQLIQNLSKNAAGNNVTMDSLTSAKFSGQYFNLMNKINQQNELSRMKHDVFRSDLMSTASSAGIDISTMNF